ncbi:hypothetical protein [Methylorubrum zatmanii]|uniref:Uncharacterized protein n=1 Tax=Methylorubrum zatmanii TaxID=29429 RepID=A0ABW1X054_9HYPH|nr:hypothetical protein [Methylorubrum zatmanii]MBD8905186.1 hypothetical protein [Methylorubrum zatmanii]
MPLSDRNRASARQYLPEAKLGDLAGRLRRLASHKGLVREQISSPLLLRLLPRPSDSEKPGSEAALLQRLLDANLDAARISYLMANAEQEIAIAHSRLSG